MQDNKLIAEFMGYPNIANDEDKRDYLEDCVKYHTSWDWLMPVIEKCLVGEAEQSEEIFKTIIKNIYEGVCSQDISFTYKSVVEFIKNQNTSVLN